MVVMCIGRQNLGAVGLRRQSLAACILSLIADIVVSGMTVTLRLQLGSVFEMAGEERRMAVTRRVDSGRSC